MTKNKKTIITIIAVYVAVLFLWALIRGPEDTWICVDGQWVKHGAPSAPMPTKPCGRTTRMGEADETDEYASKIRVESPKSGDMVKSPLEFRGTAIGSWFFEASFPVKITDQDGNILGQSIAWARGDWMTSDFAPFGGEIEFTPTVESGYIVFEKDNPSGLPENADEYKIPIKFEKLKE